MLFKKRLKIRAEQAFDKLIVDPSFMKNNSLTSNSHSKPSRRRILVPVLGACGAAVLTCGIAAGIIIANSKNSQMLLKPVVEKAMRLDNQNEILREFESNASFVFGGTLTKKNADGKAIDINNNLVEIDSSEFKEGRVGNYTINCHLKSDRNAYVSYNVLVNDEVIDHIKINNYRNTYYVGESVLNDDIDIIKVMKSGKEVHALPTEIDIDDSNFSSSNPGKCSLSVNLLTNKAIKAEYEVDVKPLEEMDLHGDYAYELNYIKVGTPIIRAFNINGKITPEYSSIHISGKYKRTYESGQIIIDSADANSSTSQTIRYVPHTREMIVYSSRADRERICFLMSERDVTFTVGNVDDKWTNYKFVAKNGYISDKEIDYFKFHYGGVYFDKDLTKPVNSLTHLDEDTTIYVGRKQIEAEETGYIGHWYSESSNNEMSLTITQTGMGNYGSSNKSSYTASEEEDQVIIRKQGYVYAYDKLDGHLYLLDEYSGKRTTEYQKYDPNTHFVCTLIDSISRAKRYIVYELGDSLNKSVVDTAVITRINASYYYVNNIATPYYDEPIVEDVTAEGNVYHSYLNSYFGKYGSYNAYWQLTDNFGADRQDRTDHHHFLTRVENGIATRVGWVNFSKVVTETHGVPVTDNYGEQIYGNDGEPLYREVKESYFIAHAYFEDHGVKEIKIASNSNTIDLGNGWVAPNETIWSNMPFIGTYETEGGKRIGVLDNATLSERIVKDGDEEVNTIDCALVSLTENEIVINCVDKGSNSERIEFQLTINRINNRYQFTYNGETYFRKR